MTRASRPDDNTTAAGFYSTPELTQRINLIHHLLQHSEQLLLVLADDGKGKTTMLNQIVANASEHWKVFTVTSTPTLSEQTLITALLATFNVRTDGKTPATLRDNLRTHIAATRYNGQLPVLLIDDAHMLPLETLSFLVRLVMTGEPQTRMRVLLFCEPQITSIFAAPEFEIMRNTLIHTLDIPPFSEKQVRGYLLFHLNQARYSAANPFTDSVVHGLYETSEGIPARIEELAQEYLTRQADRPPTQSLKLPRPPRPRIGLRHALVLGALVLVFGLLILITGWIKRALFSPADEAPLPLPAATKPASPQSLPPALQMPPATPPVAVPPAAIVPSTVAGTPAEAFSATHDGLPTVTTVSPLPESEAELPDEEDFSSIPGIYSDTWLKKQNPAAYTLQILSTYEKDAIPGFIERHRIQGDFALIVTKRRGKPYYKLVYGLFDGREQAVAALNRLPASLRRTTRPWPRPMQTIQAEIK